MKEMPTFRLELEQIGLAFGPKRVLTLKECSEYTGKSLNWCRHYLEVPPAGITQVQLADKLSHL